MTEVFWRKYSSWSGCKIIGSKSFDLSTEDAKRHMWRAVWLTSQIETGGRFGSVQSYDGAGISAGLEHKVALFPKSMQQGPLWKLLRDIEIQAPCQALNDFWESLKEEKMFVSQDGHLRHWETGRLISGHEIRNLLTPPGGRVPKRGFHWENAKKWALLFHNLFSDESTHRVQINSAVETLNKVNGKNETQIYKQTVGAEHPSVLVYGKNISPENDLAWCVYHSYSVNAPTLAKQKLSESAPNGDISWPYNLIKILGSTNYGRWSDTFDGGNRYDRTRYYAMNSGMWPEWLFEGNDAIMPRNLL